MTPLERIAAICRALLQKTVENGCTEGEALAAAAKLAKLLHEHNLTLDEVQMRASPFTKHTEHHTDDVGGRLWKPASAIAELTGCRYWISRPGVHPCEVNFFGFAHEVEIAKYMLEICAYAMRGELERLIRAKWPRSLRRSESLPYLDGMADRLCERIHKLKEPVPTGTGLVVLRGELIAKAMADAGITTQKQRARNNRDFDERYRDGRAAADRVSLNRGLRGAPQPTVSLAHQK